MKRSTNVLIIIGIIQVFLTVISVGYFLLFEILAFSYLLDVLTRLVVIVIRLGLVAYLLWRLYLVVKRDIRTQDNAIVVGVRWWLVGQVGLDIMVGASFIFPSYLSLINRINTNFPFLLILVEVVVSFLIGVIGFHIQKMTYKRDVLR